MPRLYSKFTVKTVDSALRRISGIATTPSTDRIGDIVDPLGASYELPLPFLWQHDSMQPVGHVTGAKASQSGITVDVQLAQIDEPGTLQDRLNEAWQSIKTGLVRGMSIGFAPIEYVAIKETGGLHFTKWAWLELSAVTIPANADASISAIKAADARNCGLDDRGRIKLISPGSRNSDGEYRIKLARPSITLLKPPLKLVR